MRSFIPFLLAAAALLAGCAIGPELKNPGQPAYVYVVGPGDVLTIKVFDEAKLEEKEVVVTPDGKISFPLIGTISALDQTLSQVKDGVTASLVKTQRFADPKLLNVTVILKESKSAQVQVIGEVNHQGPVPFRQRMSLVDAIGAAYGCNWYTAKSESVHVVRGSLEAPKIIKVDLEDVMWAAEKNVYLEPGDIVVVPPKYVTQMDRWITQALSPIRGIFSAGREAAATAVFAP